MKTPPSLRRRLPWETLSLGLACILVSVSILTLIGWIGPVDELAQPVAGQAPLKANGALAFALLGAVMIGQLRGRRVALWAIVPALLAALTLAQDLGGFDLGLDQFLATDHLLVATAHPGRMAAPIAGSLALAGLVMSWRASQVARSGRRLAEAIVGSFIGSVGLSALVGHAVDLEIVTTWGTNTTIPPLAAGLLVLLGVALVAMAWAESVRENGAAPAWASIPTVIGGLTLACVFFLGLRAREHAITMQATAAAADSLGAATRDALEESVGEFERMARRWGDTPTTLTDAFPAWEADVRRLWADNGATDPAASVAFVDLAHQNVWQWPRSEGESAPRHQTEEPARSRALAAAQRTGAPVLSGVTPVTSLKTGEPLPGAVIYVPVLRGGRTAGFLAAEFSYSGLFQHVAVRRLKLRENYHVTVSINGAAVYTVAAGGTRETALTVGKPYAIAGQRIRFELTPSARLLAEERRYLPEIALGGGFVFTALLGLSVHLARSARVGQRAAERSNQRLCVENEERRRIEARLKVSDERLRLALDSTQIGIFEWNVPAGHVYYSPGLWAMLGYDYGRMPSNIDAWQSLIHPEDITSYRRRLESQLNGIATFIEPEYRIRARTGEWRWVYSRGKTVATLPGGTPSRIVGTVQDITPRREAELALRASQAEARKLSLVAAKTDNPVLIGAPDGTIEWVNEAFCRVLEYRLEEVVGRNPAHFLVGPETSRRTVVRIRAAMARGEGISTDIVNYSKSGRKYHLHLEIQPVRGAGGALENFIAVQTDITARVGTEQALRRAKAEADDASRAKSEFLASMSHEIRTPMNGVIGMTSLLLESPLTGDQRDYVNTIRTSGEALLTIINDILDFSKIESGKMELERAPFELGPCIEDALDLFGFHATAKRLELVYHISQDVPAWIVGDATRLRQIIVNLVNNAVKFTPSGSIAIQVRRCAPAVPLDDPGAGFILEFTVRDTGIGIPPDRLDRLFKAFSQVDSSTTRKYGGTGLGLAICHRLCELLGGTIRAESSGEGSSFIFTVRTEPSDRPAAVFPLPALLRDSWALCVEDHPVAQARLRTIFQTIGVECTVVREPREAVALASQAAQPPAVLVVDAGEYESRPPFDALAAIRAPRLILHPVGQNAPLAPVNDFPVASTSKPLRTGAFLQALGSLFARNREIAADAAQAAARPLAEEFPLEVLLAEDNMVNQKVALRFLQRLGYRAEAVANGLEAVNALESRHYDLVLMDVQMPEMDGYEATRQIRLRIPTSRQPKIFALTANALPADRDLASDSGMDDHLSKPVKMHEISDAIRRHFAPPVRTGEWIT